MSHSHSACPCLLLLLVARVGGANVCTDDESNCAGWASAGECQNNPGFMLHMCKLSCGQCGSGAVPVVTQTSRESWETEDLTRPYGDTAIADLDGSDLRQLAARSKAPVFAWFYAPWCKQCKIVRPSIEEAAQSFAKSEDDSITFAKLDCVADTAAKNYYGVTSCEPMECACSCPVATSRLTCGLLCL